MPGDADANNRDIEQARKKLLQQPGPYAGALAGLILILFNDLKTTQTQNRDSIVAMDKSITSLQVSATAIDTMRGKDVTALDERLRRIENAVNELPALKAQVEQLTRAVEKDK